MSCQAARDSLASVLHLQVHGAGQEEDRPPVRSLAWIEDGTGECDRVLRGAVLDHLPHPRQCSSAFLNTRYALQCASATLPWAR